MDVDAELEDLDRVYEYDARHWGPFTAKIMYAITVTWRFGQRLCELIPGVKFLKSLAEKYQGGGPDAS